MYFWWSCWFSQAETSHSCNKSLYIVQGRMYWKIWIFPPQSSRLDEASLIFIMIVYLQVDIKNFHNILSLFFLWFSRGMIHLRNELFSFREQSFDIAEEVSKCQLYINEVCYLLWTFSALLDHLNINLSSFVANALWCVFYIYLQYQDSMSQKMFANAGGIKPPVNPIYSSPNTLVEMTLGYVLCYSSRWNV